MRLTLLTFHQFTYKFKKRRKNAERSCREIWKLKKSLDGGKLWYLDSGFAILQDTRVVYKMQQAEKCWRGFAVMARGQQFHPSAKLSPLDLERRKLSRRITVFPRFLSPLSMPVVQKHSTRFFNGNFTLPLQRRPFVSTCMIMLSPMQTLFAPVSRLYVHRLRAGVVTSWICGKRLREMQPTAEIILHVLTPL